MHFSTYCLLLCLTLLATNGCPSASTLPNSAPAAETSPSPTEQKMSKETFLAACRLYTGIRDHIRNGTQPTNELRNRLEKSIQAFHEYYTSHQDTIFQTKDWVFPLYQHDISSIGKGRNNGFRLPDWGGGYFDPDCEPRHPAFDLFIVDRNKDGREDATKQLIRTRSMSGGVVIDSKSNWTKGDQGKGGNYVWIYDPVTKGLFYYAHHTTIEVETGDIIRPGQFLGTVGRTGLNAQNSRSDTHLHMAYYRYNPTTREMDAVNFLNWLKTVRTK